MRVLPRLLTAFSLAGILALAGLWAHAGIYGLNVLLRHGGTYWISVRSDSSRLSPSMRLALGPAPAASVGELHWRSIAEGFETTDLPVIANGEAVDHILLARVDSMRFRFVVRNASAGDKGLDQWMTELGAALVVNGSYYARDGKPATPFLSDGEFLGPPDYDAKAGAFVSSSSFVGVRDLKRENWKSAFLGAENAMVSFPLLVASGITAVTKPSRWLANRSFIAQDTEGRIVIGTTTDAFFSLDRLARFLQDTPLNLSLALNLDGGPVASQGISLNGYERKTEGRWEIQVEGDQVQLLTWPYGSIALPIVLAIFPR